MPSSSFYVDGENYSEYVVPEPNNNPAPNKPSQAPSSFYQSGNVYTESNPDLADSYATQAAASAAAALASQNAAATSETNAASSATSAANSATTATSEAGTATTQASAAAASATSAAGSASTATTEATNASTSATAAATSATNAASSASSASTSATAAATSETNAASSASSAATSETNAASSATSAATSATNAASVVQAAAGTATPLVDGTAAVGTGTKWAREDHVHPTDTSRADAAATTAALALKAPLASPVFTGVPEAPTPTTGDNSTKLATTAFVAAAVTGAGVASLNGQTGALTFIAPPQGRLTLASGVPVMATTQASKTTLYYTPYVGNQIPIYDGTNMVPTAFSELSIATTDTTYNPAAIGANKVNDWFVWNDGGTLRLSHGPDWTSDTTRSAGTALTMVNGIWLNNADITNGPAALRGTYVGTTRSDVANQLNWIYGDTDTTSYLHVFNAYNRKFVSSSVSPSGTWSYGSTPVRSAKGNSIVRINFVSGLPEEAIKVDYLTAFNMPASQQYCDTGFAMDSTTTYDVRAENQNNTGANTISLSPTLTFGYKPVLGAHFISGNESGDGVNNTLFIGGNKHQLTFTSIM